jgi:hypothetical protein
MAGWGLPRTLLVQVYLRLQDELAAAPDQHLGDIVFPFAARSYRFSLTDPAQMPHRHFFLFVVERDDAARELNIIGCRHTTGPDEGN